MQNLSYTQPLIDQSERLPENSTFEQRFIKYENILLELQSHGIVIKELSANGDPVLEDETFGFKITHARISWDIFTTQEIVNVILKMREDFLSRK
jgi:hypothetical protein